MKMINSEFQQMESVPLSASDSVTSVNGFWECNCGLTVYKILDLKGFKCTGCGEPVTRFHRRTMRGGQNE